MAAGGGGQPATAGRKWLMADGRWQPEVEASRRHAARPHLFRPLASALCHQPSAIGYPLSANRPTLAADGWTRTAHRGPRVPNSHKTLSYPRPPPAYGPMRNIQAVCEFGMRNAWPYRTLIADRRPQTGDRRRTADLYPCSRA